MNSVDRLKSVIIMLFAGRHCGPKAEADYRSRDLCCTPYSGNYEDVAGWVVALRGSPPRGTVVISFSDGHLHFEATFIDDVRSKRITAIKDRSAIDSFLIDKNMRKRTDSFVVKVPPSAQKKGPMPVCQSCGEGHYPEQGCTPTRANN